MESTSMGWHFILEKKQTISYDYKTYYTESTQVKLFISASTSSRCKMFVRKAPITNLEIIIPGPGNKNLSANSPSNVNMCLRRLNSHRLSVLIPSKTSGIPSKVDPNSPKQVQRVTVADWLKNSTKDFRKQATTDGTSSMFIFNALVLSLTRPNFFSRAIIEPRVQAPRPAPPGSHTARPTLR